MRVREAWFVERCEAFFSRRNPNQTGRPSGDTLGLSLLHTGSRRPRDDAEADDLVAITREPGQAIEVLRA